MMSAVWKYQTPLSELSGIVVHEMPDKPQVLSVCNQGERLTIYASVDPRCSRKVARQFLVLGTGHPAEIPFGAVYLGTALFQGGDLVLHVWDLGE